MAFRLLHVLPSLDIRSGGPLRLVVDLAERALAFGLDSEIVGTGSLDLPDCPLPNERIHWCPAALPGTYAYSPALNRWLRSNLGRFHAVLIHGAWTYAALAAARECRRRGTPYGVVPHGMLEAWAVNGQGIRKAWKKRIYWRLFERQVYHSARCILFASRREQQQSLPVFALPPRQAVLPVYGVESDVPPVRHPANPVLERPAQQRWALFLGRLHPKKNLDFLLRAWREADLTEDWRLIVAGPGEPDYLKLLKTLVAELELDARVRFVGLVSGADKAYLLEQAEWFLLPSRQENFAVAVLEAIAHRCPVAISDCVGLAESFPPDAEILPLELPAWVEFLRRRMPDAAWRQRRLETDRERLLERFEMNAVARAWAETLPRVLKE